MREDLFSISGQRGIPTLVDGDVVIADDDDAIIAYLEGRFAAVSAAASPDQAAEHARASHSLPLGREGGNFIS